MLLIHRVLSFQNFPKCPQFPHHLTSSLGSLVTGTLESPRSLSAYSWACSSKKVLRAVWDNKDWFNTHSHKCQLQKFFLCCPLATLCINDLQPLSHLSVSPDSYIPPSPSHNLQSPNTCIPSPNRSLLIHERLFLCFPLNIFCAIDLYTVQPLFHLV